MKIRTALSNELLKSVKLNKRFYYNALQIFEGGFHSFKSFAFELLDDEREEVLPYIKSLYTGFYFLPNLENHQQFMDSLQTVEGYKLDDILKEWKNNFRFEKDDFYAIEIARSIVKKLLKLKDIVPKDIVAIGHYLYALERLPVKTDGIDAHIEISYKSGDERLQVTKIFVFRLNEEYFHIDVCGIHDDAFVRSDSISYPSWYVDSNGGRGDCDCKLAYLENEIDELLSLGATVRTEDYSNIEEMNRAEIEGSLQESRLQ